METKTISKDYALLSIDNATEYFGPIHGWSATNTTKDECSAYEAVIYSLYDNPNSEKNIRNNKIIDIGPILTFLKKTLEAKNLNDMTSMVFYSLHRVYDSDMDAYFFLILTDFGTVIIDNNKSVTYFLTRTELNNSDKALQLNSHGKYVCIQYGVYDFDTISQFIVTPSTSQFHLINTITKKHETYDFYPSRYYDKTKKFIIKSLKPVDANIKSPNTTLFCDKMGHVNITKSPEPQTMTLDGFSVGFSGVIKWSDYSDDSLYFTIRGEVCLNDINKPSFLFKVTSNTKDKEDIFFDILRKENSNQNTQFHNYNKTMNNVEFRSKYEYTKLINGATHTMRISPITESSLQSTAKQINIGKTADASLTIYDRGLLVTKTGNYYGIGLRSDNNDFNSDYLLLGTPEQLTNRNDKYTDSNLFELPDILTVEAEEHSLSIIGKAYPNVYADDTIITYKLVLTYTKDDCLKIDVTFCSDHDISNVFCVMYEINNNNFITTHYSNTIKKVEAHKFYTV